MQTIQEPLTPSPAALPLYTVADAALALGVSTTYIYEQIRDNLIPTVELGTSKKSKLRIRADSLQAFIQERTSTALVESSAA